MERFGRTVVEEEPNVAKFTLFYGDIIDGQFAFFSSGMDQSHRLAESHCILSNFCPTLQEPCFKIDHAQKVFQSALVNVRQARDNQEILRVLFAMLNDRTKAPGGNPVNTEIGPELEAKVSSIFLDPVELYGGHLSGLYGTVSSTVLLVTHDNRAIMQEISWSQPSTTRTEFFSLHR